MSCESMQKMKQAKKLMEKVKQADTAEKRRIVDKEIDKLDVCPEVKAHMREHLYAGVPA